MRTFEFDDGKSQKFWNITLQGDSFTVTFGKTGTKGQTQVKSFADAAKALKEHDKLVAEKVKKGYAETTVGGTATAKAPASAPATGGEFASPLRSSLETALVENPEDLASHMAYADYLHEQGDARGDFIQVQLALEDTKLGAAVRKALTASEQALLKANEPGWLGPLAASFDTSKVDDWRRQVGAYNGLTWRRGWVDTLRIDELTSEVGQAIVGQQHLLRLLRTLILLGRDYENPGFADLLKGNFFGNVTRFQIGRDNDGCHMEGENTVEFVKKMPRLEELHCYARHVPTPELFAMKFPHLRKLTVHHIYAYPLEVLASNKSLGNVTHLSFWPHGLEPDAEAAYITPQGAQAIFQSKTLKSLQHLELRLSDTGDEGMEVLVKSGLLKRLKTLGLNGGCVTDAGAQTLAACPDLRNLERLDLSTNMLTAVGIAALHATGITLEVKSQVNPNNRDEHEYLWEGDPE